MVRKVSLVIGFAAGYVLGARSGRERYEQIVDRAERLWRQPTVQSTVQSATDQAQQVVHDAAATATQVVKDKVGSDSQESMPRQGEHNHAPIPAPTPPQGRN